MGGSALADVDHLSGKSVAAGLVGVYSAAKPSTTIIFRTIASGLTFNAAAYSSDAYHWFAASTDGNLTMITVAGIQSPSITESSPA